MWTDLFDKGAQDRIDFAQQYANNDGKWNLPGHFYFLAMGDIANLLDHLATELAERGESIEELLEGAPTVHASQFGKRLPPYRDEPRHEAPQALPRDAPAPAHASARFSGTAAAVMARQEEVEDDFDKIPAYDPGKAYATEKQVKAIYAIGRAEKRMSESQVDDRCAEVFGVAPSELTKAEASQFIDLLKGEPGRKNGGG